MNLESHLFISLFEPEQATQLCQIATVETLPTKTVIFEEGEVPDFLYLVLEGEVEFRKQIECHEYQTIAKAFPNDFFGEFGILDGKPRSAQAILCGEATLGKIPRHHLLTILDNTRGGVVIKLFRYIIQRLRVTTEDYVKQLVYKEKMVLVGEMVNTVIHDLKSPVSGILLASSVLKDFYSTEDAKEWCELIQIHAQRLSAMADDLLEYSRVGTVLKKHTVNLTETLKLFERLNRVYLRDAKVDFGMTSEEITLYADENKLLRVWQNLLNNAVEAFRNPGGKIEIIAKKVDEWVEIQFKDNGPGIPVEIQDSLFESFVTFGKQGGIGLGTAITKSIIEAHDGKIWFETDENLGTTFFIRLPINYP
ncbi:MAG: ATP-binding protein [Chroococcales cyanobacterium]